MIMPKKEILMFLLRSFLFLKNPSSDNVWLISVLIVTLHLYAITCYYTPIFGIYVSSFQVVRYILELIIQCLKYRLKTKLWISPGLIGWSVSQILVCFCPRRIQHGQIVTKSRSDIGQIISVSVVRSQSDFRSFE